jgi:hypothetical protein
MKKTLAGILSESREQAQKTVDVIDKLIEKSKEAGVEWPELEEEPNPDDYELIPATKGCIGCVFYHSNGEGECQVAYNAEFDCTGMTAISGIFIKKQPEDE